MILPDHERCREILDELADEPNLNDWEREFIESNADRKWFTDAQRAIIAKLDDKFEV